MTISLLKFFNNSATLSGLFDRPLISSSLVQLPFRFCSSTTFLMSHCVLFFPFFWSFCFEIFCLWIFFAGFIYYYSLRSSSSSSQISFFLRLSFKQKLWALCIYGNARLYIGFIYSSSSSSQIYSLSNSRAFEWF